MKILSFNWHTPYLSMLAMLDHSFEIAPPNIDAQMPSWDTIMRPITDNVTPITREESLQRLGEDGYYDLVLAHNVKDIIATQNVGIPKILLFHNRLSTEAQLGNNPGIADEYRGMVRHLVSDIHCVFISQTKKDDWGLEGQIIMPGVDVSLYGGYTGVNRSVLRVGNSIKARDLMTGYSLQEKVLAGLPNIVMGVNPDIPQSVPSKGWDDLKKAYRENRLFLNTTMPPWEDGYNLGMLEAMATGMPVVSLANPTSPITDGVDGFVSDSAEGMRERVVELLDNLELAKEVGENGRRMVEQKFSMTDFLEKWDAAIRHAHGAKSKKPEKIVKANLPQSKPGGKNIILSYTSYPATAAAYMEKAFREKHSVLTTGCKITPQIIEKWNLGNMKAEACTHDILTPDLTVEADYMLARMPDGFAPDFFLWVETGLGRAPEGLEKLDCPKAAYLIDTHIHFERDLIAARKFDVVFLAQRAYIPQFKEQGIKNVFWLPLGCDPVTHGKAEFTKEFDLGFVGSLTDERRVMLLQRLAEKVDVRYDRLFLREMTDFFCKSRIIFNNAIKNDLNMRVFEGLCAGSMLLTDDADGLGGFFIDREHLVVYNDDNIAELADFYIRRPDERERIAKAGRKLVLDEHTYAHRVDQIVKIMDEFML